MSNFFLSSPWPGLLVWSALYVSDYALTITCARLYRNGVNKTFVFEGSFEITPYFQKDIDSLRLVSPRFLVMLLLIAGLLAASWLLYAQSQPELYEFVLGVMILIQLAVHTRHLRNLFLFRAVNKTGGVSGRIEYCRALMLRMSSAENLVFSGVFLLLFAFTQSWFILGGAAGCLTLAVKHYRLARKCSAGPKSEVQTQQST